MVVLRFMNGLGGWMMVLYVMFGILLQVLGVLAVLIQPDYTDTAVDDASFRPLALHADALGASGELLALWLAAPLLLGSAACGIAAMEHCGRRRHAAEEAG